MAMMVQVLPLTAAARDRMPAPCADCVFWQHPRRATSARLKERWTRSADEDLGSWGRMLFEDQRFRGLVQYGPSERFPRARTLPAGPPGRVAALITCAYLAPEDAPGTCERLVLEALADLKARGWAAVEAFALGYPDEVPIADRFVGHHTLFDRAFLARLGFEPSRVHGQVALMRLALAGLEPAAGLAERLARRLWPEDAPGPAST